MKNKQLGISHVSLHAWELYMWVWMTRWTRKQKVGPSHTCHPCETQHFSTHTHTYKNKSGKRQLMALMHWLVFVSEFLAHGGLYLSLSHSFKEADCVCVCEWGQLAITLYCFLVPTHFEAHSWLLYTIVSFSFTLIIITHIPANNFYNSQPDSC